MKSIDYINMMPVSEEKVRLTEQANTTVQALAKSDELFALYLHRTDSTNMGSAIEIDLPTGSYNMTWTDTKSGAETPVKVADHTGGWLRITSPEYREDIAMKLMQNN